MSEPIGQRLKVRIGAVRDDLARIRKTDKETHATLLYFLKKLAIDPYPENPGKTYGTADSVEVRDAQKRFRIDGLRRLRVFVRTVWKYRVFYFVDEVEGNIIICSITENRDEKTYEEGADYERARKCYYDYYSERDPKS